MQLRGEKFDIVFMDPPYDSHAEAEVLKAIAENGILAEDALIVVEARLDRKFDIIEKLGFEIVKEKEYKTSKHVFIKKI